MGVASAAPGLIHIQGALATNAGTPIDDTVGLKLALYGASVGGVALHEELHPEVSVVAGIFDLYMGDGESDTPLSGEIFADPNTVYLQITVVSDGTESILPRVKLGGAAYALYSASAGSCGFADDLGEDGLLAIEEVLVDRIAEDEDLQSLLTGPTGETGEQGPAGEDGAAGARGEDGAAGAAGAAGSDGISCEVVEIDNGATISCGDDSVDIFDGQTGAQGAQGDRGQDGAEGPQGPRGVPGDNGQRGLPGDRGADGDDGAQGVQGVPGQPGAKGDKGDKGDTGDRGIRGFTGEDGAQGVDGQRGPKGDQGDTGDQGIQGVPGNDGNDGEGADVVASLCVALGKAADCDLASLIATPPEFVGALTRDNGNWAYGWPQTSPGIPQASLECTKWYPGARVCSYKELKIAAANGDLVGAIDRAGAAVTSLWAVDHNEDFEQQCSHNANAEAPWTYQTGDQGDTGRTVSVNRNNGTIGNKASAGCGGSHWIPCCAR